MFKKLSALAIAISILTACTSSSTPKQNPTLLLEPGMTKQEVISVLGLPYKKLAKGKFEAYLYYKPALLSICFDENGKLEETMEHNLTWNCRGIL